MNASKLILISLFFFVLTGSAYSQKTPQHATLTVCENTDDDVNPINPKSTVKVGEGVVYQIAFDEKYRINKETEPDQFFIYWEVYKMDDEGKDVSVYAEKTMTVNSLYKRYAIVEPQYFNEPGKYRIYAIPQGMTDVNFKNGNYKNYFAKTEIEVVQ